jgi:hypothetical protein
MVVYSVTIFIFLTWTCQVNMGSLINRDALFNRGIERHRCFQYFCFLTWTCQVRHGGGTHSTCAWLVAWTGGRHRCSPAGIMHCTECSGHQRPIAKPCCFLESEDISERQKILRAGVVASSVWLQFYLNTRRFSGESRKSLFRSMPHLNTSPVWSFQTSIL